MDIGYILKVVLIGFFLQRKEYFMELELGKYMVFFYLSQNILKMNEDFNIYVGEININWYFLGKLDLWVF